MLYSLLWSPHTLTSLSCVLILISQNYQMVCFKVTYFTTFKQTQLIMYFKFHPSQKRRSGFNLFRSNQSIKLYLPYRYMSEPAPISENSLRGCPRCLKSSSLLPRRKYMLINCSTCWTLIKSLSGKFDMNALQYFMPVQAIKYALKSLMVKCSHHSHLLLLKELLNVDEVHMQSMVKQT